MHPAGAEPNSFGSATAGVPEIPAWRSMLFVPVTVQPYVRRAHQRGADAVVLDLEDSIAAGDKERARAELPAAVEFVSGHGCDVIVRINPSWRLAVRDLEVAVRPGVRAIAVPKVRDAEQLDQVDEIVSELEAEAGLRPRSIRLIGMIESPRALFRADEIARSTPRLQGLVLGAEDFAAETGTAPDSDLVAAAKRTVALAASVAGLASYGVVGAISNYTDLPAFRAAAQAGRGLGHVGAYAIHPIQVGILNEVFTPSRAEVDQATSIVEAYEQAVAAGRGSTAVDGRMVDEPVVRRARRLLLRAQRFAPQSPPT